MNSSSAQPLDTFNYKHIIFDCDSTMSAIEGIDILAQSSAQIKQQITALTNDAMDGRIDLSEVYVKRMDIIKPHKKDIEALTKAYIEHQVVGIYNLITLLKQSDKEVYVVSGGLYEPVYEFSISLGVKPENIRAVQVEYDSQGHYQSVPDSPLTQSTGKAQVIEQMIGDAKGRRMMIGDGISDYHAHSAVDLFVGYGGVVSREQVKAKSDVFIEDQSLAAVAVLAGVFNESHIDINMADIEHACAIIEQVKKTAINKEVIIKDPKIETHFQRIIQSF